MAFVSSRQRRRVMAILKPSRTGKRGIWHTQEEHRILNRLKAKHKPDGADGVLPDGKKVEVRSIRADDEHRYRLDRDTHKELLKSGGDYIFIHKGQERRVKASTVDGVLNSKNRGWYKDRDYPHTFIFTGEVL